MEGLSGTLFPEHYISWIKFDAPSEGQLIFTAYNECGTVSDTLHIVVAEPFDKTLDLGPDQVVCDNGVFTLNAGSGFTRYRWQNGSPDSVLTTLLPGKYWVDVWDACGAKQTDTVLITVAPATVLVLGGDRMGCPDLTAVFQRPDFFTSWQWSPADFISCDTCASVTVSPAATTSWIVVAQTEDDCISVDTMMFQIQDTLFFELDTSVCAGQTIDLFGMAFPADTTAQFFFPAPGLGCDTLLTVNVLGLDAPFLEIEKTICAGAFFIYNGIALPADTTAVFLQPGAGGECDSVVTVVVKSWPLLTVTLPPDTTLRVGASLILNAETSGTGMLDFQWSPADGLSCTNCPTPETSPLETTLYTLTVADANGCRAQDSMLVTVDPACFVIIPNAFTPNGDGINDFFYPKTDPCVRRVRVWRVVSRWGEMVFERQNFEPGNPSLGWDGNQKNGEPFPSDVLAWYAELEYYDGRVEVRKGDVALLR
jgi:gliding motility-associated-like protein